MKNLFSTVVMMWLLLLTQNVCGQQTKISFADILINVNGQTLKGTGASVSLVEGKTSEKLTLFKNDSIAVFAAFRLNPQTKKSDAVKDASFGLEILYTFKYNAASKEEKADRLYFLNDAFQFTEKATININESKYSNIQLKIGYKGTVIQ